MNAGLRRDEGPEEAGLDVSGNSSIPEIGPISLETQLAMYAWHCDHHIAHVESVAG